MKRFLKIILLFALLAAAGGGFYLWRQGRPSSDAARYVTARAERGDIRQFVSGSGTLNPVTLVNVGTQISGVVRAIHADFNDKVAKDQVLAELDQSLLNTQLDQSQANLISAKAALRQAEANYRRTKILVDKDYVARADLDTARQALDTAAAQVKNAEGQVAHDKINIGYSIIRSPVAGVIISRDVDVGQTVAASFQTPTLFKIAEDLKQMQIDTNMAEADVGAIKPGMAVFFTVDAFPDRKFEGKTRQIRLNPATVQNVVTYDVVIDVQNEDLTLLPGMTAFVRLMEAERNGVLRVPAAALSFRPAREKQAKAHDRPQGAHVYVLRDGAPALVKVEIGISDGKLTEITGGELAEGDAVITEDTTATAKTGAARNPVMPMGGRPF